MSVNKSKILILNEANAAVLVKIITGSDISESLRIQAMQKLTESKEENQNFFKTIFDEKLDWGKCPNCDHQNRWLTPEDQLNQMGYVSQDEDERVPEHTNAKSCSLYQEACLKKKVTI